MIVKFVLTKFVLTKDLDRGNSRKNATKKRGFQALPDSEIYTTEYLIGDFTL